MSGRRADSAIYVCADGAAAERGAGLIVVFGAIALQWHFPVPGLPVRGDTLRSRRSFSEPGGRGADQALAARRDGAAVRLAGAVGRDVIGAHLIAMLAEELEMGSVARLETESGRGAALVDEAGRIMAVADDGANAHADAGRAMAALPGASTLLLQLDLPHAESLRLALAAREAGKRVLLHLSPRRNAPIELLRAASLLAGNSEDLAWFGERLGTGNNPASLHGALGIPAVRMMGTQGAEAFSDKGYFHVPAMPVRARDSSGADDCFLGVLAAALDRDETLPDAVRRAGVAAALCVRAVGSPRAFPRRTDIDAALPGAPRPTRREAQVRD